MRKMIQKMVELDDRDWHRVAMKMVWHFRTDGAHEVPPIVMAAKAGVLPTHAEWEEIRKAVNAARRADKRGAERYERKARMERRRAYQRRYMRQYRAAKHAQP